MPVTYLSIVPNAKYPLVRSYLRYVQIANYSTSIIWIDNEAVIEITDSPNYYHHFVFKEEFWTWSSNCYTLDHVLDRVYYQGYLGNPAQVDFPIRANLLFYPPALSHIVRFSVDAAPFLLPLKELEAAPPGYWRKFY